MGNAKRAVALDMAKSCEIVAGELVGIVDDRPVVRLHGSASETVAAASMVPAAEFFAADGSVLAGCGVMLALRGRGAAPVVLGVIRERLGISAVEPKRAEKTVLVDGDRIVLQGSREIVLKCGPSEILLRADGKVIVKGHDVVSRASRRNRLKGATVGIN
jgi:hypothetical protein